MEDCYCCNYIFFPVNRRDTQFQARSFTALVDMTNLTDGTALFMNCPHRQGNLIPKLWLISSFFQRWLSHYVLTSQTPYIPNRFPLSCLSTVRSTAPHVFFVFRFNDVNPSWKLPYKMVVGIPGMLKLSIILLTCWSCLSSISLESLFYLS